MGAWLEQRYGSRARCLWLMVIWGVCGCGELRPWLPPTLTSLSLAGGESGYFHHLPGYMVYVGVGTGDGAGEQQGSRSAVINYCSGVHVGEGVVMTAAHCFYDRGTAATKQRLVRDITLIYQYRYLHHRDEVHVGKLRSHDFEVRMPQQYEQEQDVDFDVALILVRLPSQRVFASSATLLLDPEYSATELAGDVYVYGLGQARNRNGGDISLPAQGLRQPQQRRQTVFAWGQAKVGREVRDRSSLLTQLAAALAPPQSSHRHRHRRFTLFGCWQGPVTGRSEQVSGFCVGDSGGAVIKKHGHQDVLVGILRGHFVTNVFSLLTNQPTPTGLCLRGADAVSTYPLYSWIRDAIQNHL